LAAYKVDTISNIDLSLKDVLLRLFGCLEGFNF
jgi:hypothetical protein